MAPQVNPAASPSSLPPAGRFVVLRHEMPEGSPRPTHWDFMLEAGPVLRTWALAAEPLPGGPIAAEALFDHRREYLTFAGAIAGGRGTVARWDAGVFERQQDDQKQIVVSLAGGRLRGTATLSVQGETPAESGGVQRWRFSFVADPL